MEKQGLSGQQSYQEKQSVQPYTPLQVHFLARLANQVQKRNAQAAGQEGWLLKALDRALFASYQDCVEQGVEAEAQAIVRGEVWGHGGQGAGGE